jgi:hypothetical protein
MEMSDIQRLMKDEPFGRLASTKKQLRLHTPQYELSKLYSPRFRFICTTAIHDLPLSIGICWRKISTPFSPLLSVGFCSFNTSLLLLLLSRY